MGCNSSSSGAVDSSNSKPTDKKGYKFTYFPIGARGELSRYIFAVAKQPYTDDRINWQDWPALKPNTPFGQLPLLTVDGVTLCQSSVIATYLARKFNLAGENALEQARAAMIVQCVDDAWEPLTHLRGLTDDAARAEMKKNYVDEKMPAFLKHFDDLLRSNDGGDGYFVGKKLTYADLAVLVYFREPAEVFGIDVKLDNYSHLKALKERVESDPGLAEWLQKRPKSIFPPM